MIKHKYYAKNAERKIINKFTCHIIQPLSLSTFKEIKFTFFNLN